VTEAKARSAMLGRGLGRCELCRRAEQVTASHRIGRAQCGPWTPPNVLGLCHDCHMWLTYERAVANAGGWILSERHHGEDLTEVPVWLNSSGLWPAWFTLDELGDAHPVDTDAPAPPVFPPYVDLSLIGGSIGA
jgi:hypothetical protein